MGAQKKFSENQTCPSQEGPRGIVLASNSCHIKRGRSEENVKSVFIATSNQIHRARPGISRIGTTRRSRISKKETSSFYFEGSAKILGTRFCETAPTVQAVHATCDTLLRSRFTATSTDTFMAIMLPSVEGFVINLTESSLWC